MNDHGSPEQDTKRLVFRRAASSALLSHVTLDELLKDLQAAIDTVRPILDRQGVSLPDLILAAADDDEPLPPPVPLRTALDTWIDQQPHRRAA